MTISINDAISLIRFSIQTGIPALLAGATGVGKSGSAGAAISTPITMPDGKSYKYRMQTLRLASKDETDIEGIPVVDDMTKTTMYGRPPMIVDPEADYTQVAPTIYFCDEINRWPAQVRQTMFSAFHDNDGTGRYFGEHRLRPLDRIIAAFNPASDGYDVEDLDPALLARGSQLVVEGTMKEWRQWAMKSAIEPDLVEFFASGDAMELATEYKPSVRKTPRTCEYAARAYMLWKALPKNDRPSQNQIIHFLSGLIGSQADNLIAFLNERSDRPIPAGDIMTMKAAEIRTYMDGLKKRNRNDVFAVLSDSMDTYLTDQKDGLNKTQKDLALVFLEGLPKDILSKLLTGAMSTGSNTGKIFNDLATDRDTQNRMSKLMESAMTVNTDPVAAQK